VLVQGLASVATWWDASKLILERPKYDRPFQLASELVNLIHTPNRMDVVGGIFLAAFISTIISPIVGASSAALRIRLSERMSSGLRDRLARLRGFVSRDESPRLSDESRWYTEHTAL